MKRAMGFVLLLALLVLGACGEAADPGSEETPEPAGESPAASVRLVAPEDGSTVSSPVGVEMEATGVTIEPAASGVRENAGHFHVVVDAGCVSEGEVIPADASHIHYGMAQTEAELELAPGEHELCLQVADGAHVATALTDTIRITVE